ncbi:MAG: PepSY-like domain-containing protein [Bacteroidia bacterium]
MKALPVFAAGLLITAHLSAQKLKEADVPKPVTAAFSAHFKNVKAEKWEKKPNGTYKAEFEQGKSESAGIFSAEGELLETETELKISGLPKAVTEHVAKNYEGFKIEKAEKIMHASGSGFYGIEIKKGRERKDLIYNASGVFVKDRIDDGEVEND